MQWGARCLESRFAVHSDWNDLESPPVRSDFRSHGLNRKAKSRSNRVNRFQINGAFRFASDLESRDSRHLRMGRRGQTSKGQLGPDWHPKLTTQQMKKAWPGTNGIGPRHYASDLNALGVGVVWGMGSAWRQESLVYGVGRFWLGVRCNAIGRVGSFLGSWFLWGGGDVSVLLYPILPCYARCQYISFLFCLSQSFSFCVQIVYS